MNSDNPFHYRIEKIPKLAGFAVESALAEQQCKMLVRGFVHSDQREFNIYADQIFSIFAGQRWLRESINICIIQIHRDRTADVHVNDIDRREKVKAKRDIQAGEAVHKSDIADIAEVRFANVTLNKNDGIVYCFRIGWKFGLFFDFLPLIKATELDLDEMAKELARYHKYLLFQDLYGIIQKKPFNKLFEGGWFPFIALIGGDFEHLAEICDDPNRDSLISGFMGKFNKDKLYNLSEVWWRIPLFNEKKDIILAGLDAYLTQTKQGYITCIKNLYSEIEGILRLSYFRAYGYDPKFRELKKYAADMAQDTFISEDALSFPTLFYKYLDEVIFRDFNLDNGVVNLSRHTIAHGVAPTEQYTQEKALQAILTIDQISRFIG